MLKERPVGFSIFELDSNPITKQLLIKAMELLSKLDSHDLEKQRETIGNYDIVLACLDLSSVSRYYANDLSAEYRYYLDVYDNLNNNTVVISANNIDKEGIKQAIESQLN